MSVPSELSKLKEEGKVLVKEGKIDEAIQIYHQIIEKLGYDVEEQTENTNPPSDGEENDFVITILNNIVICYNKSSHFEKAQQFCEMAVNVFGANDPKTFYRQGFIHEKMMNYRKAIVCYKRVLGRDTKISNICEKRINKIIFYPPVKGSCNILQLSNDAIGMISSFLSSGKDILRMMASCKAFYVPLCELPFACEFAVFNYVKKTCRSNALLPKAPYVKNLWTFKLTRKMSMAFSNVVHLEIDPCEPSDEENLLMFSKKLKSLKITRKNQTDDPKEIGLDIGGPKLSWNGIGKICALEKLEKFSMCMPLHDIIVFGGEIEPDFHFEVDRILTSLEVHVDGFSFAVVGLFLHLKILSITTHAFVACVGDWKEIRNGSMVLEEFHLSCQKIMCSTMTSSYTDWCDADDVDFRFLVDEMKLLKKISLGHKAHLLLTRPKYFFNILRERKGSLMLNCCENSEISGEEFGNVKSHKCEKCGYLLINFSCGKCHPKKNPLSSLSNILGMGGGVCCEKCSSGMGCYAYAQLWMNKGNGPEYLDLSQIIDDV